MKLHKESALFTPKILRHICLWVCFIYKIKFFRKNPIGREKKKKTRDCSQTFKWLKEDENAHRTLGDFDPRSETQEGRKSDSRLTIRGVEAAAYRG